MTPDRRLDEATRKRIDKLLEAAEEAVKVANADRARLLKGARRLNRMVAGIVVTLIVVAGVGWYLINQNTERSHDIDTSRVDVTLARCKDDNALKVVILALIPPGYPALELPVAKRYLTLEGDCHTYAIRRVASGYSARVTPIGPAAERKLTGPELRALTQ